MQAADPHPHLTVFLAIWAAVGPLAGIMIGHFLTRSLQRKLWLLDCRKAEFRELLDALSEHFSALLDIHRPMYPQSQDDQERLANLKANFFQTIHSRIFVAADIERLNVEDAWLKAVNKYLRDFDIPSFVATFDSINRSVVQATLEEK